MARTKLPNKPFPGSDAGGTVSYPKSAPDLGAMGAVGYDPRYGGIPTVPNPAQSAGAAITGNIGNLGPLYNLAGGINQFQNQQATGSLIANLPNYQAMVAQQSGNIGSELQGKLPQDVINQIRQQAAERGVATGTAGSPNDNAEMLRALGLTSLGMEEQGASDLQRAIGETPQPGLFDLNSMLINPEQQQAATAAQHLYLSAPIPSQAAAAGEQAFAQGTGFGAKATPSWAGGGRGIPAWGGGTSTGTSGADPFNIPGEIGPLGSTQDFSNLNTSVGGSAQPGVSGNWNWNGQGWTNSMGQNISAPLTSPTSIAGSDMGGLSTAGQDMGNLPWGDPNLLYNPDLAAQMAQGNYDAKPYLY